MIYLLSQEGVFRTVQGEGILLGLPMVFVRFGGCSVGCDACDTEYSVAEQVDVEDLVARVEACLTSATEWIWLTGGEPTDQDLSPLLAALHHLPIRIALATAGVRKVQQDRAYGGVDFLSVSPHDPLRWVQRSGDQLNLVPGLNGLSLTDPVLLALLEQCEWYFNHRWVTPCDGLPDQMPTIRVFIETRPGWRLGVQAQKVWGLP